MSAMGRSSWRAAARLLLIVSVAATAARGQPEPRVGPTAVGEVSVTVVQGDGGRVDWCRGTGLVAFDRLLSDGNYDVFSMRPDGTEVTPLTVDHRGFPGRHIGQPAWHPDGRFLLVQAEKNDHFGVMFSFMTTPGGGHYNDVWALDLQTHRATCLREMPCERNHALLHPQVSPDGQQVAWGEMFEGPSILRKGKELGYWDLMIAEFAVGTDGQPRLRDPRAVELETRRNAFYEVHGFTPDGRRLLVTSNCFRSRESALRGNDVCLVDLDTGEVRRLTEAHFNEHGRMSPDGRCVVWASDRAAPGHGVGRRTRGTDYWMMEADGSSKRRLTCINEPGHAHHLGNLVLAADFAWGADSRSLVAYLQIREPDSFTRRQEMVVLIEW